MAVIECAVSYRLDVLSEDDALQVAAVIHATVDAGHVVLTTLAVGHLVGNDDVAGLLSVGSIRRDAVELRVALGTLIIILQRIAVSIGYINIAILRLLIETQLAQVGSAAGAKGVEGEYHGTVGRHLEDMLIAR